MHTLVAIALAATLSAPRETLIFGDIVMSYNHYEATGNQGIDTTGFSFDQADIAFLRYVDDWTTAYLRLTATGSVVTPTEAYVKREGLPYDGSITIGKFYKPLGAPIPLTNLSFPALIFHAHPEVGIKGNFSRYPWNFELGIVNGNPLAATATSSATIGNSYVASNTHTSVLEINKEKDYYGRIAYAAGEDWGSLTVGLNYTYGELSIEEITALNPPPGPANQPSPIGAFISGDRSDVRRHFAVDIDFQRDQWRIFGEYMNATDGRLQRRLWSIAHSYTFDSKFGEITPTIAFDHYDINSGVVLSNNPRTWNRERLAFSLAWWPLETIQVIGEYSSNRENARTRGDLRQIDNDEFTIQTVYYF